MKSFTASGWACNSFCAARVRWNASSLSESGAPSCGKRKRAWGPPAGDLDRVLSGRHPSYRAPLGGPHPLENDEPTVGTKRRRRWHERYRLAGQRFTKDIVLRHRHPAGPKRGQAFRAKPVCAQSGPVLPLLAADDLPRPVARAGFVFLILPAGRCHQFAVPRTGEVPQRVWPAATVVATCHAADLIFIPGVAHDDLIGGDTCRHQRLDPLAVVAGGHIVGIVPLAFFGKRGVEVLSIIGPVCIAFVGECDAAIGNISTAEIFGGARAITGQIVWVGPKIQAFLLRDPIPFLGIGTLAGLGAIIAAATGGAEHCFPC